MEAIEIRESTVEDLSAITRIHYAALSEQSHEFYGEFFALEPREILVQSTTKGLSQPDQKFLVASDKSSGEMVGYIRYFIEPAKTTEVPEEAENPDNEPSQPGFALFLSKKHLKELWERFCQREDEMEACYVDAAKGQRHTLVKHLMVDPRHQRRGIGGKLLSAVVAKSDAEGIPTFLVASAEAYGLYLKLGFQELGTFIIDNEYWAKEMDKREEELGLQRSEKLGSKFKGMKEVERYMVRWSK